MIHLTAGFLMDGHTVNWHLGKERKDEPEGVLLGFPLGEYGSWKQGDEEEIEGDLAKCLAQFEITWLRRTSNGWALNLGILRAEFPDLLRDFTWLDGVVHIKASIRKKPVFDSRYMTIDGEDATIVFKVTKEVVEMNRDRRVFLCHKGVDKPLVQQFQRVLEAASHETWLDVDQMPAGTERDRAIRDGFRASCAAIFFVTKDFVDEAFIRAEINHAVSEKRERADRFALITVVFRHRGGGIEQVPPVLTDYVYAEVDSDLGAVYEILRAIPLKPVKLDWTQ